MDITFANPVYLWFLLTIPWLIFSHFFSLRYTRKRALKFANFIAIERITGERMLSKNYVMLALRLLVVILLVFSLAGMRVWYEGTTSNFDFILTVDSSGSMLAEDYKPNRIEAAKNAAMTFVDSLPEKTKVGVISFAGVSFIKQKPTYDMDSVRKAIENISVESIGGTAIGSAIITSTNLLTDEAKAKIIILLTDGQNNVGPSVEEAIKYANENYVTIHTIGIGTKEGGTFPNLTFVSKLDSTTLELIANKTQGKYYEPKNEEELSGIYKEIALSSTQKLFVNLSLHLLVIAFILLFIEYALVSTMYRAIP
jgi:Ca-activated chloride channel family protein